MKPDLHEIVAFLAFLAVVLLSGCTIHKEGIFFRDGIFMSEEEGRINVTKIGDPFAKFVVVQSWAAGAKVEIQCK